MKKLETAAVDLNIPASKISKVSKVSKASNIDIANNLQQLKEQGVDVRELGKNGAVLDKKVIDRLKNGGMQYFEAFMAWSKSI